MADKFLWQDFDDWVEVYREPFIQRSTLIKYKNTVAIIKDCFGNTKTTNVRRIDIQKVFNKLSLEYGIRTNKNFYLNLKAFYQSLVDDGELDRNPMNGIRFTGIEVKNKKKYLEASDVETIINVLDLEKTEDLMIYTSLKTGMRFAEVLGITSEDIYEKENDFFISVNKTLDYKYTKKFKTTKTTTSMREVSIDRSLCEELKRYIKSNDISNGDPIFGVVFPVRINRILEKMCVDNQVEPISFHGLRHTHGSLLLMKGVPIISVSKRLGHASLSITQDVYIHLMEEQERNDNLKIIEAMEDF